MLHVICADMKFNHIILDKNMTIIGFNLLIDNSFVRNSSFLQTDLVLINTRLKASGSRLLRNHHDDLYRQFVWYRRLDSQPAVACRLKLNSSGF